MEKKLIRIFILLVIMTLISGKYDISVSSLGGSPQAYAAEEAPQSKPAKTNRRAKKTSFTSWKRNPFATQKIPGGPAVDLELKGIVWYGNIPKAMLNDGLIVGVGDKIGSDVVVDITEDSVTLKRGTEQYKIKLEY